MIGNGAFGNLAALTDVPAKTYMHKHNNTLRIPNEILKAFDYADQHCGFNEVLKQITYPPRDKIYIPGNPERNNHKRQDACFTQPPKTPALIKESVNALCYGGCATWSTAKNYLTHKRDW